MRLAAQFDLSAWLLGSAVAALIAAYWVFAPALGRFIGDRFTSEGAKLSAAEEAAWTTYRETGEFPGVDEETLKQPGWQHALMATERTKAFR